jgi:O-antigen ligase
LVLRFLLLLALFGIVEYFSHDLMFFHLVRSSASLQYYPRISSIMQGPNQFGVLMSIGVLLALILYRKKAISTIEFYFSILLFIMMISLAASRNGWLVFLSGVSFALLYRIIKLRGAIFIVSLLSFFILFFPVPTKQLGVRESSVFPLINLLSEKTIKGKGLVTAEKEFTPSFYKEVITSYLGITPIDTMRSRFLLWKAAINEIIKKPITGVGIQVFEKHIAVQLLKQRGLNTHNLILNILVELGIPGLLLVLILTYSLLKRTDLYSPIIGIPVIMIFSAQIFDFFIYDFTFTTIALYFLAEAGNSKSNEDN